MKLSTTPAQAFTPDPGMSWLRHDPEMQCLEAFRDTQLITICPDYGLMAPYIPGGTTVLMKRVNCAEEITDGIYWLEEHGRRAENYGSESVHYKMGRYERTDNTYTTRKGAIKQVRLAVSDDNKAIDAPRRADGTIDWYVDFTDWNYRLYRITHYVRLPRNNDTVAYSLDMDGSLSQEQWMADEKRLHDDAASEFSLRTLGGFPEPDLRVLLSQIPGRGYIGGEVRILNDLVRSLKPLPASVAKRRKAGAVEIVKRGVDIWNRSYTTTDYYKSEEVETLVNWLTSISRYQRALAAAQQEAAKNRVREELKRGADTQCAPPAQENAALAMAA